MAGILRLSSKRLSSKNKHGFVAISSRSSCHPAEIWMNVEPIKDRQRFTLALAAFWISRHFSLIASISRWMMDEGGRKHIF